MLAKTVTVVLLAFMLQTEALPAKNQNNHSSVEKTISQELDIFNAEKLASFIDEHKDVLEELIPSVASKIYKIATCKADIKAMVLPHIDDIMACINITISVYDIELFLYDAFQFGLEVYDNAVDLGSDILECRSNSSDVFDFMQCALDTVQNSSSMFEALLNRISELILEFANDYHGLTDNIKKCTSFSSTSAFTAWRFINNQC